MKDRVGRFAALVRQHAPLSGSGEITTRFAWRGIAEAMVLIAALLLADVLFGSGHRFLGMEPHPFGIAVLLVAAQYGTAEAAATAILASAALLLFNVPEQAFEQDHSAWLQSVVRDPLIWFAASLVIGEISGRIRTRARESANLATRREGELEVMVQANAELTTRIKQLETRIVGQQRTVTSIYEAARGLGPDRASVLSGALALVRAATGATGISVYLMNGNALASAGGEGSIGQAEPIPPDSALFQALVSERRCLVANNAADREVLDGTGLLAGPLLTPDGAVMGALVVDAIPFTQLHLGAVGSFRSVCEWVAAGLERAERYDDAQQGRFLVEGSSLVAAGQAERVIAIMGATARRIGFNLTLMQLDLAPTVTSEDRRTIVTVMEAVLRDTDLLIEGENPRRLRVLMPGTPLRNVPLASERLLGALSGQGREFREAVSISWLSLNEVAVPELVS